MLKRKARGYKDVSMETHVYLRDDLIFVWNGFNDLHRARTTGFGIEPLKLTEILAWLDLHLCDAESRVECYELISYCDYEWLKRQRDLEDEKTNKKNKKKKKKENK